MYPWTRYMWSLCNIFINPPPIHHAFCGALRGPISKLMGIPIFRSLKTFQLYFLDSVLSARWFVLPTVYTCLNDVALAKHSEATRTPRVICVFECVCVHGEWDHYPLSRGQTHCPCLHTAVCLPTHVSENCGPLENPMASWWVWCSLLPRSLHSRCPLTLF